MEVKQAISEITSQLPVTTRLVAVSKFHPADMIREAYDCGQRIFGESHVQELQAKRATLPDDIQWHFIGHLQTNKVKYIVPYIDLIHAVDTPRLLQEISRQAERVGRQIPCLLEIHVAQEETKYGFTPQECLAYLASGEWRELNGIRLAGLMCMASFTDDEQQIAAEFSTAENLFNKVKKEFFAADPNFCERSWGMSHDWKIALQHGSTMVRIGSQIFGERNY